MPADAPVRRYFIAAELIDWDYTPLGKDGCSNQSFTEDQEVRAGAAWGGGALAHAPARDCMHPCGSMPAAEAA